MCKINIIFSLFLLTSCSQEIKNEFLSKQIIDSLKSKAIPEALNKNDYESVENFSNLILKNDSTDYEGWKNKTIANTQFKKYELALWCANKAIMLKKDGFTYYMKGFIFEHKVMTDSAVFYLKRAYELDSNLTYIVRAAEHLSKNKRGQEALDIINGLIKRYPNDLKLYAHKGGYLSALGYFKEALENFNKAEKGYPSHELYAGRAIAYTNLNNLKGALADLDTAISKNPYDARYYDWRGLVKYDLKRYEEALEDLKTASEMGNEDGKKHYNKLLVQLGKIKSI